MLKVVHAECGQGSGRGAPRVPGQAFQSRGRTGGRRAPRAGGGQDSQAQHHRGRAGREAVCRDCHREQTMTVGAALEVSWGVVGARGPEAPTVGVRGAHGSLGVASTPRCRGPRCRGRGGAEAGGSRGRPPGAGPKATGLSPFLSSVASAPCLTPLPSGWVPVAGPTHPHFSVHFVSAGGAACLSFPVSQ